MVNRIVDFSFSMGTILAHHRSVQVVTVLYYIFPLDTIEVTVSAETLIGHDQFNVHIEHLQLSAALNSLSVHSLYF